MHNQLKSVISISWLNTPFTVQNNRLQTGNLYPSGNISRDIKIFFFILSVNNLKFFTAAFKSYFEMQISEYSWSFKIMHCGRKIFFSSNRNFKYIKCSSLWRIKAVFCTTKSKVLSWIRDWRIHFIIQNNRLLTIKLPSSDKIFICI